MKCGPLLSFHSPSSPNFERVQASLPEPRCSSWLRPMSVRLLERPQDISTRDVPIWTAVRLLRHSPHAGLEKQADSFQFPRSRPRLECDLV